MAQLDKINGESAFSTLVVLPTGGGKTYTATTWLLKNAVDRKKKILWIAHRQVLLEQAAESFQKFAYAEAMPHIKAFNFRVISGASQHDRMMDILKTDNILIASKDCIGRNLEALDHWLKGEKELFVVIDEAHHATAKTYRKILDYVRAKVSHIKLIGLTATPFRTAKSEEGLLSKIFKDGVDESGQATKNEKGIAYQIGLKELINKRILAKPIFEDFYSDEDFGEGMSVDEWEHIQQLDILPQDIAGEMASNAERNKLIVQTYKKGQKKYGQTIVFAVNVLHAITLSALFNKAGITADYVVSDIKDAITGVTISREDNERKIKAYQKGELQVLVNVNILTEGVDLPQTQTVFLTRPTVSTILMTQMIGRALRGTAAGGTNQAYIVSFIDKWHEHIAWVNPESIFSGNNDFVDTDSEYMKKTMRLIAISKIEEFAAILDQSVNTSALEAIPFMQRVPVGMYAFSYLEEDGMDLSYQVMVYDSTREAYCKLMEALPDLFATSKIEEEYLSKQQLSMLEAQCHDTYFCGEMLPPYESRDVMSILKYYAQYEEVPKFYTFEEVDRSKVDISKVAKHIWEEDMGQRRMREYLEELWDDNDDNLLRLYFRKKMFFWRQVDIELMKLSIPDIYTPEQNVVWGQRNIEDLSLYDIRKIAPNKEKELRDQTFNKFLNENGEYYCAHCGMSAHTKIPFQVDHIIPMNKGGKSVLENLQILCRSCNGKKGDA
ncbi:MAG: DEAD/DEAH box helicase family protein [Cellulosilyticum sp.]|nr:DEAD/DEAH box helicase family protein [Cellulosilyticum sp.]